MFGILLCILLPAPLCLYAFLAKNHAQIYTARPAERYFDLCMIFGSVLGLFWLVMSSRVGSIEDYWLDHRYLRDSSEMSDLRARRALLLIARRKDWRSDEIKQELEAVEAQITAMRAEVRQELERPKQEEAARCLEAAKERAPLS